MMNDSLPSYSKQHLSVVKRLIKVLEQEQVEEVQHLQRRAQLLESTKALVAQLPAESALGGLLDSYHSQKYDQLKAEVLVTQIKEQDV